MQFGSNVGSLLVDQSGSFPSLRFAKLHGFSFLTLSCKMKLLIQD